MVNYVTFWSGASDDERCETTALRARLLGMTIDLGDDAGRPDEMIAIYETEDGGILVYDVDYLQSEDHMRARLRRYGSLEAVRRDGVYSAYLERLEII
jgi:hypothetical protein